MQWRFGKNRFLRMKKGIVKVAALTMMAAAVTISSGVTVKAGETRQVEALDRGLVAVKTSEGVFLSWRLLGSEEYDTAFNVYRNGDKIAGPITDSTNYQDVAGTVNDVYTVRTVVNGKEEKKSREATVWSNDYKDVPIEKPGDIYSANDATVADVDGDGSYEIILKWDPSDSKDNSQSGKTSNVYIDCYEMDGTKRWRIDLGVNIRAGAHYTQFIAYDLNGDGKAEVAMKTADGTVAGDGTVIGDASKDYRNDSGYILDGPEYLTLFEGSSGKILTTIDYEPARGTVSSWGDKYGNRVDRFLAGVAYLNGRNPSLVVCRGYYTRAVIVAYQYRNGQLNRQWTFDTNSSGNSDYAGQGNHNLTMADVDEDGCDEIVYGSAVIDHTGKGLYSTKMGHGDALHVGDFDPDHQGLEIFQVHEEKSDTIESVQMRDAKTGTTLWSQKTGTDVGRGLIVNIGPDYYPYVVTCSAGNFDKYGNKLDLDLGKFGMNFAIWWDADLYREGLDKTYINKWNYNTKSIDRLLTGSNVHSNNSTKATPSLSGDILGDWREEVIWPTSDDSALRIYTTTAVTQKKLYTLVHDVQYRESLAWQNVAYNQPPHTSYYMGEDMPTPVKPNVWPTGKYAEETVEEETVVVREKEQVAKYSFEQNENATVADETGHGWNLYLKGNASCVQDAERGNVLYLDGEEGTYAEFAQGTFDGIQDMTVSMNVKSESTGYFFNFTVGKDDQKYYFNNVSTEKVRSAITVNGWQEESNAESAVKGDEWHNYTFVLSGNTMKIYIDGNLVSTNEEMKQTLADLGTGLTAYIGKSFFANDSYFKGYMDNLEVYSYGLSAEEVADLVAKNFPAAHQHTAGEWQKNAISHWNVCSVCGEKVQEETHTFGDWSVAAAPSCETKGQEVRTCTICGYQEMQEMAATGHNMQDDVWCSDAQGHWHGCADCEVREDQAEHSMEWIVEKAATVYEEGIEREVCTVCGYKGAEKVIAKLTTQEPSDTQTTQEDTAQYPDVTTDQSDETTEETNATTEQNGSSEYADSTTESNSGETDATTENRNNGSVEEPDATTQSRNDNSSEDSDSTSSQPEETTQKPGTTQDTEISGPPEYADSTTESNSGETDATTENRNNGSVEEPDTTTQSRNDNSTEDPDSTSSQPEETTQKPGTTQDTEISGPPEYADSTTEPNPGETTEELDTTTESRDNGWSEEPDATTQSRDDNSSEDPDSTSSQPEGTTQKPGTTQDTEISGPPEYPDSTTESNSGETTEELDTTTESRDNGWSEEPDATTESRDNGWSEEPDATTESRDNGWSEESDTTTESRDNGWSEEPDTTTESGNDGSSNYPDNTSSQPEETTEKPGANQDTEFSGSPEYPDVTTEQNGDATTGEPDTATNQANATTEHTHHFQWVVAIAATADTTGYGYQQCSDCGYRSNPQIIPALAATSEQPTEPSYQIGDCVEIKNDEVTAIYQITVDAAGNAGEVTYVACKDTENAKVIIPDVVIIQNKVYKVTAVADGACKAHKAVKQVVIGNNVTVIGKNAFAKCSKLTKVKLGKKVKKISKRAFYQCKKLKTVTFQGKQLKTVGKQAFKGISKKAVLKAPKAKIKKYSKLCGIK